MTARAQLRALSTSSVRCSGIVADLRTKDGRYPRIGLYCSLKHKLALVL